MRSPVGDADFIRRQNRGLVLDVLRRKGPLPRVQLAAETGLSNATISAIAADMIAQNLLSDQSETAQSDTTEKTRGRPRIQLGFNRLAGFAVLIELDVNRSRCSLVDYGGTLSDRIEMRITPQTFVETRPVELLATQIAAIRARNPEAAARILRVAISSQGILDRAEKTLIWSPIPGLAGTPVVDRLAEELRVPVALYKRGRLLAEGTRGIYPHLHDANVATVFVGSTVAMGISNAADGADLGTEFGHMNHLPDGALCRCGMRGCVEAYAADYGVLRSAYGVPDKTPPAPSVPAAQYGDLIQRGLRGERNVLRAFQLAGRAIGFGINRLMTIFDPSHIVIVGPGADALPLMQAEMEAGIAASIVARVQGTPHIMRHRDESEPIFRGLMIKTLRDMDQTDFAALPAMGGR